ncbi:MAG: response regulator transcription factor [Phycisphaerae bacterium]|nr:response regulator transcription factor [Phycisphaerae bacterium]
MGGNIKNGKKRILIVDDHPIIRCGLRQTINNEPDMMVCGEACDTNEARKAIRDTKPDMAIIDISLKDSNGLDLIKDLRNQYPNLYILTNSVHSESVYGERVLRAGARGYITKDADPDELLIAIRKVLSGQLYTSETMATRIVDKMFCGRVSHGQSPVDCLSDRELEVFQLIGQGFSTRQIADRLFLSVKTIGTYRAHIQDKLRLSGANDLLQYAIQWTASQIAVG